MSDWREYRKKALRRSAVLAAVIIGLVIAVGIFLTTVVDVPPGYASLVVDPVSKTVTNGPTGPAWVPFSKAPWASVVNIKISVDRLYMWTELDREGNIIDSGWRHTQLLPVEEQDFADDWDAPIVLSKDGLNIIVDLNVKWTVDPTRVKDLYLNYPDLKWKSKTITPAIREIVRDLIVQYNATDVYNKRAELTVPFESSLKTKLSGDETLYGAIAVQSIELLDIALPPTVVQAIEQKQASLQAIETAINQRQATLIQADASRQKLIIEAEGIAQSRIIDANGTRSSIDLITEALGGGADAAQLYYVWTQLLKMAQENPSMVFVMGQGNGTFIQIPAGGK